MKTRKSLMSQTAQRRFNFLVRGVCNSILLNTICRRDFDITKTLVVAGSSRSGSTWLAEIVSAAPGYGQIFEPLNPSQVKAARKAGIITHDIFVDRGTDWPAGKDFMRKVLQGQILTPWTSSQIPLSKTKDISCLVVKFVRANMLLGWLCANFPIKPPALIIRHPCATIASQAKKGWPCVPLTWTSPFFTRYPELKKRCQSLVRPEEVRAIRWCMQYFVPLSQPGPYPFVLLSYESLVRHGEEELARLYGRWGLLPVPAEAFAMLRRPSKTVTGESQVVLGKDPLVGWKKYLSKMEVANILKVVDIFGLNFYTDAIEPDYERLGKSSSIVENSAELCSGPVLR